MDWMVTLRSTSLQTVSWMPSVTRCSTANAAATGCRLHSQWTPTSVCAFTRKVRASERETSRGRRPEQEREDEVDHTAQKIVCRVDIEHRCRGYYLSRASQVGTHIWRWVLSAIIYDFLQDLKALRPAL